MPLRVHFLNVGNGDTTIVEFPSGRLGVVDVNKLSGFTNPVSYLKNMGIKSIFRFILTHPHKDHLCGFKDLKESFTIENFWDIDHNFEPDKQSDQWECYKPHWEAYKSATVSARSPIYLKSFKRGNDKFDFLIDDKIEVLSPTLQLEKIGKENLMDNQRVHTPCFVLRISHAGRSVVLGGDANATCWEDIYESYKGTSLIKADVLKAAHHGHESGYHKDAVNLIQPQHVFITASRKEPCDASEKYRSNHQARIYPTWDGENLVLTIDDQGQMSLDRNKIGIDESLNLNKLLTLGKY